MSTLRGSVRPRSAVGSASDSRVRGSGLDTRSGNIVSFHLPLFQEGQLNCYVHLVLVTRLEGQSLLSSSVVMLNQKIHREYLLLRDEYQIYFIDCDENINYLTSA